VLFRTRDKQWMIHRMDPPADPDRTRPPNDLKPMLATLESSAPKGDGWAWELKWDGIRALGYVDGGRIRLVTRNGNDVTRRYPELRRLGEALGTRDVVLDGEIVAFGADGRPSFELLQRRMHVEGEARSAASSASYPSPTCCSTCCGSTATRSWTCRTRERRARLRDLDLNGALVADAAARGGRRRARPSRSASASVSKAVVAKRLDSRYEAGRRSRAWIKIKNQRRQEFVVGGWQPGEKGRTGSIGSLLVGYYDERRRAALRGQGRQRPERTGDRRPRDRASRRTRAPTARSARAASRRACGSWSRRWSPRCASRSGRPQATSVTRRSSGSAPTRTRAK
jgi:bifunctional non-homologous end joining protein LigD